MERVGLGFDGDDDLLSLPPPLAISRARNVCVDGRRACRHRGAISYLGRGMPIETYGGDGSCDETHDFCRAVIRFSTHPLALTMEGGVTLSPPKSPLGGQMSSLRWITVGTSWKP